MILTFTILLITTVLFIFGRFRTDIVALGSLLALTLTGILTTGEALAGFSNPIVIMIAGLFVVGAGIFQTGLARVVGKQLLKVAGNNETKLLIMIMLVVAFLSAFISNTGTVAVLMPVVVLLSFELKINPAKFLIPLAYASSLGGVLTLIGTAPNLVISQTLVQYGYGRLSFFDFTPIGAIALFTGIIFIVLVRNFLLPNDKNPQNSASGADLSLDELIDSYHLQSNIYRLTISPESEMIRKSLAELKLPNTYRVSVIGIERKHTTGKAVIHGYNGYSNIIPGPATVIEESDILYVQGALDQIKILCRENQLKLEDTITPNSIETGSIHKQLINKYIGIAEVLLTPNSNLVNHSIEEIHFREKYNLNVISINRKGHYIQKDVSKKKLLFGDALLVQGNWKDIELLSKDNQDVVVLGQTSKHASMAAASGKAPMAALIMLFMLGLMTLEIVPPVIAVLISAMFMLITGCVRNMDDAYRTINWESVILIAAMLPMATALEKTGGVAFLSETIIQKIGIYGPLAVLAGFYIMTTAFSQFISNTATAVIFAPIAITTALSLGVHPLPFLMTVAVSASMAFATPVASPTNALVMTAGNYKFSDFVKVGLPLQIVIGIVMILTLPMIYPF
ncbi:tricarboxylate transporter [Desulfuribacillus stibiiarsenatis]|uniref:Tricarboxylate transporter n=2 Tax=Desulfuribacillus stibiiarsenatis TaxID=1390249 RepID=A0A1E5L7M6_9FIRM|nr:tricarboxylate transporter [Desulfuribacillus stibiiarsenatis]